MVGEVFRRERAPGRTGNRLKGPGRLGRWLHRVFAPRELLLRSGGRVRYWRLTPRHQQVAALAACGLLAWAGVASYGVMAQRGVIAEREASLVVQRLEYEALVGKLAEHQARIVALTEELGRGQRELADYLADGRQGQKGGEGAAPYLDRVGEDYRAVVAQNAVLGQEIAALLNGGGAAPAEVSDVRERLYGEMRSLRDRLAEAEETSSDLDARLEQTRAQLSGSRQDLERSDAARRRLGARIADLERVLEAGKRREARLNAALGEATGRVADLTGAHAEERRNVAALRADLRAAREGQRRLQALLAETRADLSASQWQARDLGVRQELATRQIADLRSRLRAGDERERAASAKLAELEARLGESESQAQALGEQRERLNGKIAQLNRDLAHERQARETMFTNLTAHAVEAIGSIEQAVGLTGLDMERLLPAVNGGAGKDEPAAGGKGGPFVPYTGEAPESLSDAKIPADMVTQLARWHDMLTLVASLPLWPPLEDYWLSSGFGKRRDPINGRIAVHNGIDLSAPARTPVHATAPGKVVRAGWMTGYGRMIEVDHGYGLRTRYAHLRKIEVSVGDSVALGTRIGQVGSSGRSTGPHVHYEVLYNGKPLNPANFLKAGEHVRKG